MTTYRAELARADHLLTAQELKEKYAGVDNTGEHPRYLQSYWRAHVDVEHTLLGYWAWVEEQLEDEGY